MADITQLDGQFGIPGHVNVVKGQGGLPMLQVATEWSSAEVYLHGGHVTRFQKKHEAPLLWLSQEGKFDDRSPIRGGIPIILPWFGAREGAPAHGFARVKEWELQGVNLMGTGAVRIHLRLPARPDVPGFTPFTADYFVSVGATLDLELVVNNPPGGPGLTVEECLHSYFTVGDIGATAITGLKGVKYLDKVGAAAERLETNDAIKITSEVDRVYQDTAAAVEIRDEKLCRVIHVEKAGSASTVVWNPWIDKSRAMADFGDEEYHGMVCVESGNVGKNKLTITAGQSASMKVKLSSFAI
jgi:D-hexose-6-phosphate mutarotase